MEVNVMEKNTNDKKVEENVLQLIEKVKPGWGVSRKPCFASCGYVADSFFSFSDEGYYWIVKLCNESECNYAYKEVSADWIRYYAALILSSAQVFVDYNCQHLIVCWFVTQEKECPILEE